MATPPLLHNVLFGQYVFLPTEQAETYLKIYVLIYHSTYICPSLFGWKENILPKQHIVQWWSRERERGVPAPPSPHHSQDRSSIHKWILKFSPPSWSTTLSMGLRIIRLQFSKFWFHELNHRSFIIYERVKCSPIWRKTKKPLIIGDNFVQIFCLNFSSINYFCLIILLEEERNEIVANN